jgi:hypothetical protein
MAAGAGEERRGWSALLRVGAVAPMDDHHRPFDHRTRSHLDQDGIGMEGIVQPDQRVASVENRADRLRPDLLGTFQSPDPQPVGQVPGARGNHLPVADHHQGAALDQLHRHLLHEGVGHQLPGRDPDPWPQRAEAVEVEVVDRGVTPDLLFLRGQRQGEEVVEGLRPTSAEPVRPRERGEVVGGERGQDEGLPCGSVDGARRSSDDGTAGRWAASWPVYRPLHLLGPASAGSLPS